MRPHTRALETSSARVVEAGSINAHKSSSTIHGRVLTHSRTVESSHRFRPTRASQQDRVTSSKRWILPSISRKGASNIKDMGKLRYVVELTFALLHQFKRLAVRWEHRTELHDALVSLACSLI